MADYLEKTAMDCADSLRERVYRYLEDAVCSGRIPDGGFLDQDRLCKTLGVSRTPLRDALIRLEAEGIVTIKSRKGVFVTPVSDAFIKSACQIIGALESDCLLSVFAKITSKSIVLMEASIARQEALLQAHRFADYCVENDVFHDLFLNLSENDLMRETLALLRRRLAIIPEHPLSYYQAHCAVMDHRRIVDSLKMGNCTAASSILRHERWSPSRFLLTKPSRKRSKAIGKIQSSHSSAA